MHAVLKTIGIYETRDCSPGNYCVYETLVPTVLETIDIYETRATVVLETIGVSETRVPSVIKKLRDQLRL